MKFDFQKIAPLVIFGLIIYKGWEFIESDFTDDALQIQLWALVLALIANFGYKFYKKVNK